MFQKTKSVAIKPFDLRSKYDLPILVFYSRNGVISDRKLRAYQL